MAVPPIAAGAVACEVGHPLALVSRRARVPFVPGAVLTQIGIQILLGPTFLQLMACNVFWVPWQRLLGHGDPSRAVPRASTARPQASILRRP